MIVTVPGIGYQFQESVTLLTGSATVTDEKSESTAMVAPYSRRRFRLVALGVGLIVVLTAGGLWIKQKKGPLSAPPISIPVTYYQGMESYPAISPNGQFLAFTWDGGDLQNNDIYVKQVGDGEQIRITSHPNEEIMATWSPDGNWLAFLRRADRVNEPFHLIIVPAFGGMEREVVRVYGGLDWSPDGKYLAVVNPATPGTPDGIHLISIDGNENRPLTHQADPLPYFDSLPRSGQSHYELRILRR